MVKTFFIGDVEITDSKAYLDNCVESYHKALSDVVGVRMIIKVWEKVKGKGSRLKCLIVNRAAYIKSPKSKKRIKPN